MARPLARLRAWTGLVLMAYAACHLTNHAMGLVSLDWVEAVHEALALVWHEGPGEVLLLVSLLVHVVLALTMIARSTSLRLARWQWAQLGLGLAAATILAQHVAGTVQVEGVTGGRVDYPLVLLATWPGQALAYSFMLVTIWAHGCLGLHFWWRLEPWYARAQPALAAAALLLPALAVGGYASAGRDVAHRSPTEVARWAEAREWPEPDVAGPVIARGERILLIGVFGGLAAALGWRFARRLATRRRTVRVTYPSGHLVSATAGLTLLEMSNEAGIPHAAVCGGRARCSTCRVRVTAGLDGLPPPGAGEQRLLERLGEPEGVRLACQIRPTAPLSVIPLVAPPAALRDARSDADPALGRERELAVLFCDIRGFTGLSEARLPYDIVYILNQYFRVMGEAVEAAGGRVDKVIGDGVMALFGLESDGDRAAREALVAVERMALGLDQLNRSLEGELDGPLNLAMGLHLGPVVVGEMGHGTARQLTAIGDTVNVASRLERLAKEADVQLAVSDTLLRRSGVDAEAAETMLPGRSETVRVLFYPDARDVLRKTAESA